MSKYCVICGRTATDVHHWLFGNSIRRLADQDGIKADLCRMCHTSGSNNQRIHDNPMAEHLSKMLGQSLWEKNYILELVGESNYQDLSRKAFIERYGKSYL